MNPPGKHVSRRWVLSSLLAGAAMPALAKAPARSLVPQLRPGPHDESAVAVSAPSPEALIEAAQLRGNVGFVVAHARSGQVLEAHQPELGLPPASVVKALTALYALERLGPAHRFTTRLLATGPIQGGRVDGDLILLGGGDPTLSSDDLGDMAVALKDRGVSGISGRFIVHGGVLPTLPSINPDQPDHVGYNPALSGLSLNFNRVHFQWKRNGTSYEIVMDAPDQRYRPMVGMARMRVVDRSTPVYTYSNSGAVDDWTVASAALGNGGSRWLPVRQPEHYTGDVFRTIAAYHGMALPAPQLAGAAALRGTAVVEHNSGPLRGIVEGMMRFSNNLTAEMVGLSASHAGDGNPRTLADSGRMMGAWASQRFGLSGSRFLDHSGLGDGSRLSAADMVRFLAGAGANGPLREVMRDFPLRDAQGSILHDHPVQVNAKTGTLNFVSGLGGYISLPSGADLVFAIFAANLATRDSIPVAQRERPAGGREWAGRARRLQQQLIERWAIVHV